MRMFRFRDYGSVRVVMVVVLVLIDGKGLGHLFPEER